MKRGGQAGHEVSPETRTKISASLAATVRTFQTAPTCRVCDEVFVSVRLGGKPPPLCESCRATLKWCWMCKSAKPLASFHSDRASRDGLNARCRACSSERARIVHREHTTEENFTSHLRGRYGLTLEQWNEMASAQGGRCAICGEVPKKLVVDHCHDTMKVRALLCHACNKGIGHFGDDAALVTRAGEYLTHHANR